MHPQGNGLKVTDIKVRIISGEGKVLGWATCIINDIIRLNNLSIQPNTRVIGGLRVVYPSKTLKDGTRRPHFLPCSRELRKLIDNNILQIYKREKSRVDSGLAQPVFGEVNVRT